MALDVKDPRTQKGLLAVLGLALVLYAYFFTDLLPFTYKAHASEVGDLEERYLEVSRDLNKARQAANRLPYLEKEYALLERKWEQSRHLLPEDADMSWLLRTVSLLGSQAGVEFTLFKPLPPRPAQFHTEIPVEVHVLGGYHQIGSFLGEIANLDRIINVTQLELIKPRKVTPEQPAEAHFIAVTYMLGGTGQPAAESAQAESARSQGRPAASGQRPAAGSSREGASNE